jgi:hypothetical protein
LPAAKGFAVPILLLVAAVAPSSDITSPPIAAANDVAANSATLIAAAPAAPAPVKDGVALAKDILSVLAILVGAAWTYMLFIQHRQKFPRAEIKHDVVVKKLGHRQRLVHVTVTVKNTGDVLLTLVSHLTRLQQIVPASDELIETLQAGDDPVKAGNAEFLWTMLCERKSDWSDEDEQREIEPGESQDIDVDFFVGPEPETVSVYSYFTNMTKSSKEIGWNFTSFHDLEEK